MAYTFREFRKSPHAVKPHYLVIGHPVSHSLSPLMHQTALDYYGINAHYFAVDLEPDEVNDFIAWCNRDEFKGCNITIPYKETFLEVVDEIDSYAEMIGVINTIVKSGNQLLGYNTDAFGFLMGLEPWSDELDLTRAIIFGTGGSSRAVKTALLETGFEELVFVSRRASNKQTEQGLPEFRIVNYEQWPSYAEEASLIVNTTPLGMHPRVNDMPIHENEATLLRDKICYDLVYNPSETRFLKTAKANGAITINGLHMLIYQGSKSFELWTGKSFPVKIIIEKLEDYFKSN